MESETPYGVLIHASLGVGEDNSGRLVAEVRKRSTKIAEDQGVKQVIVDGPPGIGCPVISSISGVDLALVVTEPTVAGRHDLARILGLLSHFRVPAVVCINKFDLDAPNSDEIMRYCREKAVAVVGRIPFDEDVPRSLSHGRPLISSADREQKRENAPVEGPAARELRCMWERLQELL
jgi:MinD superfamily P-loop ATPase